MKFTDYALSWAYSGPFSARPTNSFLPSSGSSFNQKEKVKVCISQDEDKLNGILRNKCQRSCVLYGHLDPNRGDIEKSQRALHFFQSLLGSSLFSLLEALLVTFRSFSSNDSFYKDVLRYIYNPYTLYQSCNAALHFHEHRKKKQKLETKKAEGKQPLEGLFRVFMLVLLLFLVCSAMLRHIMHTFTSIIVVFFSLTFFLLCGWKERKAGSRSEDVSGLSSPSSRISDSLWSVPKIPLLALCLMSLDGVYAVTFSPTPYIFPSYSCKSDFSGAYHNCVLFTDQSVKCWGNNWAGQLGYGNVATRGDGASEMDDNLPFVDVSGSVVSISTGNAHSCVILTDFNVKCWGYNLYGQLGYGDTTQRGDGANEMGSYLPAIDVGSNVFPSFIASGTNHNCIVSLEGQVKCWGRNLDGQLGQGDSNDRGDVPGEMGDYLPFVNLGTSCTVVTDMGVGGFHNCVMCSDGST